MKKVVTQDGFDYEEVKDQQLWRICCDEGIYYITEVNAILPYYSLINVFVSYSEAVKHCLALRKLELSHHQNLVDEMERLAKEVVQSKLKENLSDEDMVSWANRLANDVCKLTD